MAYFVTIDSIEYSCDSEQICVPLNGLASCTTNSECQSNLCATQLYSDGNTYGFCISCLVDIPTSCGEGSTCTPVVIDTSNNGTKTMGVCNLIPNFIPPTPSPESPTKPGMPYLASQYNAGLAMSLSLACGGVGLIVISFIISGFYGTYKYRKDGSQYEKKKLLEMNEKYVDGDNKGLVASTPMLDSMTDGFKRRNKKGFI